MTDPNLSRRTLGELQKSLERFENYNDGFILPDTFLVLRLDAHRYGDWSSVPDHEYPTGKRTTRGFYDTAVSLMMSSLRVVCAFCHGDEISLFIDPVENNSPLRRSRIISILSSAASLHFQEATGLSSTFEARLSELPSLPRVIEYFLWQRRYCYRNALVTALRAKLASTGLTPSQIENEIHGLNEELRIAKLQMLGGSLTDIPATTRHGALFWWEREQQGGREQFRIRSKTDLPEEDSEFIELIQGITRGSSSIATTQAAPSKPKTPTPRTPGKKKPAAKSGGSKKGNTSIFRV